MKKTRMQKMLALPLVFVFVAVLMVCALGNSSNAVAAGSLISGLSGSGSMGSGDPGSGSGRNDSRRDDRPARGTMADLLAKLKL